MADTSSELRSAIEQLSVLLVRSLERQDFPIESARPSEGTPMSDPVRRVDEDVNLFTTSFSRRAANPRRDTMMDRILRPDTTRLDATVYREQASYDHIKLTSLTVGHAFKFFQELDRYESRYKTSVPAPTLVSDRVRDEILVEAPHVTISDFYGLENERLFVLIQKAIRPSNAIEFSKMLQATAEFPMLPVGYTPSLQRFKPLYDAILIFKRTYLECCNFLAYENAANMPRCDHREGGLIRSFIDMIPFSFGQHVLASMKTHKFSNLADFFVAFMEALQSIKVAYEYTKAHTQFFEVGVPDTRGIRNVEPSSASRYTSRTPYNQDRRQLAPQTRNSVAAMTQSEVGSDEYFEDYGYDVNNVQST
jgi:hypothetical protein